MKLIFVFLIQLIILGAHAQSDQTAVITGKVTDQYNEPLTGVTILNSGSGTVTDIDGNYSISTAIGTTLKFSYIGFEDLIYSVEESATVNIKLIEATTTLHEVVITSLNIPRERKALGYAVQDVSSEAFQARPTNPMSALSVGKQGNDVIETKLWVFK